MGHNFTWIDASILFVYFATVLCVGLRFGRRPQNNDEYFLGGKNVPWIAVLGSLVATEVSAATFLNTPGEGFANNLSYLQTTIGSIVARFFIASCFLGVFYSMRYQSIYEYLADRFGPKTQKYGAIVFLITRLIASSLRLLIASSGIAVILGWPFINCLVGFALISFMYASSGGIKAVIYTDCVQAVVFIAGGIFAFTWIGMQVGWEPLLTVASDAGKLELFQLAPENPRDIASWFQSSQLLYPAVLMGFLLSSAAFGTDQDMTQRLLTCKELKTAKRSLVISGFIAIVIAFLFLMVGVSLFAYYQQSGSHESIDNNLVFAHFIANEVPTGLKGLLLAGVCAAAMSSLDSAMAALSSSASVDLFKQSAKKDASSIKIGRLYMGIFSLLLVFLAWSFHYVKGSWLWLPFQIAGIPYSILLGTFLLGLLSKRGSDSSNMLIMTSGLLAISICMVMSRLELLPIAWPWVILGGTLWSFGWGLLVHSDKEPRHSTI